MWKRPSADTRPVQGQSSCPGEVGWGESWAKLSTYRAGTWLHFNSFRANVRQRTITGSGHPCAAQLQQPRPDLISLLPSTVWREKPSPTVGRSQRYFLSTPSAGKQAVREFPKSGLRETSPQK